MHVKDKIQIIIINFLTITTLLRAEYPDYNLTIYNDPYPANLFIHSLSSFNPQIGMFNQNLSLDWNISHGDRGFDFRTNNERLSFYDKDNLFWIISDSNMQEIDTLSCTTGKTDYHDIRLLENGGYILQCYDSTWVQIDAPMPQLLRDILVIQEFDSQDSLILEWRATDHLSIYDYPDIDLSTPEITFMHGNSIEVDHDSNLLISNRTSNEIFKLDRQTGDIIWIMGGPLNEFRFNNDPLDGFNKQHDVRRIDNGNITLLDNGTQHNPMLSRAVEYQVDEINKTANLVWSYNHPDSLVAMSMGSVQRLPNQNTLINWGFFFETNILEMGALIMEVDYDKNIVFELSYPTGYYTYRATKDVWNFDINLVKGDSNLDDIVNVIDAVYLVNYILYTNNDRKTLFQMHKLDINTDGDIDILDLTGIVNIILNQ